MAAPASTDPHSHHPQQPPSTSPTRASPPCISAAHPPLLDPTLEERYLNPAVVVQSAVATPRGRSPFGVHVFREDHLLGGTKQRALAAFLHQQPHAKEFVYGGPVFGFAQVALAYVCRLHGRKGTAVVARQYDGHHKPLTALAASVGAAVVEVDPPNAALRDVQAYAEAYVKQRNARAPGSTVLLPFGLHCDIFTETLEAALRRALPEELRDAGPRRLWLVAGSAAILAVLAKIWPRTHFLVVQVGKTVWPDQMGVRKGGGKDYEATKYVAPEKFWERALTQPPYPTVATYDAKLWQFVEQHGQEGDHVWNVAADRPPLRPEDAARWFPSPVAEANGGKGNARPDAGLARGSSSAPCDAEDDTQARDGMKRSSEASPHELPAKIRAGPR